MKEMNPFLFVSIRAIRGSFQEKGSHEFHEYARMKKK
jgi:hypothetical protein